MFGDRLLLVDVHAVFDQIGRLEKAPLTRGEPLKPEPLKGPLKGLFHMHWFQAGFLAKNLLNETEKYGDMIIQKRLNVEFARDQSIGETIGNLVRATFEHRSGTAAGKKSRLTGEWIIVSSTLGRDNLARSSKYHSNSLMCLHRRRLAVRLPREFRDAGSPFVGEPI
jgi:hypothetical protein